MEPVPHRDLVLATALATDPTSAGKARAAVARAFAGLPDDLIDDAQLLVSEAVTDAVRTSGRTPDEPLEVSGYLFDDTVRVEVAQEGRRRVVAETDDHLAFDILDRVASRWGHEHRGSTATTWFELDLVS